MLVDLVLDECRPSALAVSGECWACSVGHASFIGPECSRPPPGFGSVLVLWFQQADPSSEGHGQVCLSGRKALPLV